MIVQYHAKSAQLRLPFHPHSRIQEVGRLVQISLCLHVGESDASCQHACQHAMHRTSNVSCCPESDSLLQHNTSRRTDPKSRVCKFVQTTRRCGAPTATI